MHNNEKITVVDDGGQKNYFKIISETINFIKKLWENVSGLRNK